MEQEQRHREPLFYKQLPKDGYTGKDSGFKRKISLDGSGASQISIFWPKSPSRSSSRGKHAIVGWVRDGGPGELVAVVADILPLPLESNSTSTLQRFHPQGQPPSSMTTSLSPCILGECLSPPFGTKNRADSEIRGKPESEDKKGKRKATEEEMLEAQLQDKDFLSEHRSGSEFWIIASLPRSKSRGWWNRTASSQIPVLRSLRIPSTLCATPQRTKSIPPPRIQAASHAISLILYTPPKPDILQFLSLEPLQLLPSSDSEPEIPIKNNSSPATPTACNLRHESMTLLQSKLEKMVALDPERCFEVTGGYREHGPGSGLRKAVELMNETILSMRKLERSAQRDSSNWERDRIKFEPAGPLRILLSCLKLAQTSLRSPIIFVRGSKYNLLDVSAAARQLDARLVQLQLWPIRAARLRRLRKGRLAPISSLSAHYIGVWNGIWLVANDLILGYAVGWTLKNKSPQLSEQMTFWLLKITNEWVVQILAWLGDWPAGLKLNTELALFFGDMYQGMTEMWLSEGLSRILPNIPRLIYSIGFAGQVLGLTMTISLMIDSLNLLTLHLTGFYSIGRTVYIFFIYVLDSLFNLFRGKKRNPLRNGRIDDASYDLDQLLLGTIFFVLLTFLFPTVFVYYLTFAIYRLISSISRIGLESILAFLNHLPLFAIMLRFKDPSRLPFGIKFKPIFTPSSHSQGVGIHSAPTSPTRGQDLVGSAAGGVGVGSMKSRFRQSGSEEVDVKPMKPIQDLTSSGQGEIGDSKLSFPSIRTAESGLRSKLVGVVEERVGEREMKTARAGTGKQMNSVGTCCCNSFNAAPSPSPSPSFNPSDPSVSLHVSSYELVNVPLSFQSLFAGYSIDGLASIPKLSLKVLSGGFF